MSVPEREEFAGELAQFDFILTLEHGEGFGPLATSVVRQRLGRRVISLPTPFFSGLMPDMAYLRYGNDIARTPAVLGDYHSALILEEVRAGYSKDEVARRYVSGKAFDRLDVEGIWADSLAELKAREQGTDISLSAYIEKCAAEGTIAGGFLSFNHPTEGLINYIAQEFICLTTDRNCTGEWVTRERHNLYADAFWPLHPAVAARLGLPAPGKPVFKQPNRLGGARMEVDEFVRRSVDFFTQDRDPAQFTIATPGYLAAHIRPAPARTMPEEKAPKSPAMKKAHPEQIILTHFGRSGSTVLAELLRQHSRIAWLDELFSLKWIYERETYNFTLQQMLDMIDVEVKKHHARNAGLMVGHEIKLMNFLQNPSCNMIDYAWATADPREYTHIVLRRRNVLKRICSVYKAAQTKVYHLRSDDAGYREKRFVIDFGQTLWDYDTGQSARSFPELISKAIAREEEVLANYRNVGISYLELTYEDDIELDPLVGYRKALAYLGLDFEPARVTLKKTSTSFRRELGNYDELEARLRNSPYEWMLAEADRRSDVPASYAG